MKKFFIENYEISRNHKPFIIAEMSGNHNNDVNIYNIYDIQAIKVIYFSNALK